MKIINFYVDNFRSLSNIRLEDLGGLNVIVGYNGYGKTNLLTAIYLFIKNLNAGIEKRSIEDRDQEYMLLWRDYDITKPITIGGVIEFSEEEVQRSIGKSQKLRVEIVNKLRYNNRFIEWGLESFSVNNSPPTRDQFEEVKPLFSLASQSVEYVPIFDQTYFDAILKKMIEMNRSPINMRRKWYDFVNLIGEVIPEIKGIEFWDSGKLVLNIQNLPIYIDLAASGFQRVILMLFILWLSGRKILLLEEPEVNMYPTLQSRIMKLIKDWTNNNVFQVFITTHSPYIISSNVDNYIIMKKKNGVSSAIRVTLDEQLRTITGILRVNLGDILFNRLIVLTSELAEPSVILNWLRRIGISNDELGIGIYKVNNELELQLWLKMREMLGLDVIFLGLCDKIDINLKDYCVPLGREIENYYTKGRLIDVIRKFGVYPDEKELRDLTKEETYRWLVNVFKKRGIDYDKIRNSIGELVTMHDGVEMPKEMEILANKIKSLESI
ncbi:ATPase [Sulfolobus sp. S-194]|uniref:ATP-dependent nuclease n=1 Tax=Sulfolobus sp. S-194 TaxID=2512240 RepID=UPI0014373AA3|nr:ATP/GTP-binding protein [Sulfolobus sp. S-194]QIW25022.1 ATPase [Sulfolobus sp. S-194]